jgi:predicted lipoprotein with Yx(FWY)xxD motif
VVSVADRNPIGSMLIDHNAARRGLSLDTTASGCNASCRTIWPPLLMPKGTTIPTGAKCLSTIAASGGRLQATYDSQPLYTLVDDSGTSVNGNGVGGFEAAKLVASCP